MTEQRLRDLLRQAVPDAPDLDAAAVRRRAVRARRNAVSLVTAAAAVLAVAVGPVALATLTDDGARPSPHELATEPTASAQPAGPLSPYDVPPCPARQPEPAPAVDSAPPLDGVVAVRLCPDLNPRGEPASWQPSRDQLAELEDADALVHDLAAFAADLRALPAGLPEHCADVAGPYRGQSFAFHRADGSRVLVRAPGCETITVEGRELDSGAVRQAYLRALERQRDRSDYTRPFDDDLACTTGPRGGPVRPGRERLVAAVVCDLPDGAESIPVDLEPIQLDADQLAALGRAWSRPGDAIVRGPNGEHECLDVAEPPSFVLAATDRSDVVQLVDTPCGFLVWAGWEDHHGATFPTTVAKLGVG